MKKIAKKNFIKGEKYIYTLRLTNIYLGFTVKMLKFEDMVSNF